jgi:hypothetical protein
MARGRSICTCWFCEEPWQIDPAVEANPEPLAGSGNRGIRCSAGEDFEGKKNRENLAGNFD